MVVQNTQTFIKLENIVATLKDTAPDQLVAWGWTDDLDAG